MAKIVFCPIGFKAKINLLRSLWRVARKCQSVYIHGVNSMRGDTDDLAEVFTVIHANSHHDVAFYNKMDRDCAEFWERHPTARRTKVENG